MDKVISPLVVAAILLFSAVAAAVLPSYAQEAVTVSVITDKPSYKSGEDIKVTITSNTTNTVFATFELFDPTGKMLQDESFGFNARASFIIGAHFSTGGTYKAVVRGQSFNSETFFTYENTPASPEQQPSPQSASSDTPATEGVSRVEIVPGATNKADKAYSPNPVKIQPGTTLTWVNADSAAHTVSSGTASKPTKDFDSKIMGPKKEYSFQFVKEGTFDYYCQLHPTMAGKIVVDRQAAPSPTTGPVDVAQSSDNSQMLSPPDESAPSSAIPIPDFGVTATSFVKAKSTSITVKNLSTGGVMVYDFTVVLPEGSTIKKVKAPRGWTGDVIDNSVIFSTEGRPLEEGKKLSFRIYSASPISQFDWQAYSEDGDLLKEGSVAARVR
ncbi:plastocyanin/azurin family copper-binding protein [Nitrososphaera sp.]|uniref:cupredoxin domain-containing protein n=1 Tax=Nitrososphaera sp. TaxID=1971748 RepID=UPI00307F6937